MNTSLLMELNTLHMQELSWTAEMQRLSHMAIEEQRRALVEERHICPPADQPTTLMHTTADESMLHLRPHRVFG